MAGEPPYVQARRRPAAHSRGLRRLRVAAALLAGAGALVLPVTAQAATATSDGTTVRVTSGPEALKVGTGGVVRPGVLYITTLSAVTIEPGAGCTNAFKGVDCTFTGTPTLIFDLGEGDDSLNLTPDTPMQVQVSAGPGDDAITTADGLDSSARYATTTVDAGPGDDRVYPGGGGIDTVIGGDGFDKVDYFMSDGPTTITLNGVADDGIAGEGDNVGGDFESITGALTRSSTIVGNDLPQNLSGASDMGDSLDGGGGDDIISGGLGPGDDTLIGGPGDDALLGYGGNDRLDGGPGFDELFGFEGDDTLLSRDGEPDEAVACDAGNDSAVIDLGRDELALKQCEHVDRAWVGPPALSAGATELRARGGRVRMPITCRAAAGAACKGRLSITTAKCVRAGGHCRKVALGHARFSLKADRRGVVSVRLSKAGRRLLHRRHSVGCMATVTLAGEGRSSLPIVVR